MKVSWRREREQLEAGVCKKALLEHQVPSVKLKPGNETGWPDRLFFTRGGPLLIEFKWEDHQPEPRQVYVHDMLRDLGYEVQVHNDENEALQAIQKMDSAQVSKTR